LVTPPAEFRIWSAQIDQAFDAVTRQERPQESGIGLRRARRLTRHNPVEIVQHIGGTAHGACVPARAIIRNQPLPGEHRVPLKTLLRRWEWLTLLAIGAFAVLYFLDVGLKNATGYGTIDLQSAQTAAEFKRIFFAWIVQAHTATAAFSLGFDYL